MQVATAALVVLVVLALVGAEAVASDAAPSGRPLAETEHLPTPSLVVAAVPPGAASQAAPVRQSAGDWVDSGRLAGVTLGALVLTPTFNSIGIEAPFTETGGTVRSVTAEFRRSDDPATVRDTLPLWPTRPADPAVQPGAAAFGSVLLAEAGTRYDIRVSVTDQEGNVQRIVATTTTRADNLAPADQVTPTHFLNAATGDDSRPEEVARRPETPWKTLRRAHQAAPPGAVVEVAPGYYSEPGVNVPRTQPITFKAQFPAVDDAREPINAGRHSVIQDGAITGTGAATVQTPYTSGPAGSDAPFQRAWIIDPALSMVAGTTVWKWDQDSHQVGAMVTQMGYHASRSDPPRRIANWANTVDAGATGSTKTREGWAALIGSNRTYRAGFYSDPDTTTDGARYDLYLVPPPNMRRADGSVTADPNEVFITIGAGYGPIYRAPDVRVTGFEFRTLADCAATGGTSGDHSANARNTFDHNLFVGCLNGIRIISPTEAGHEASDHLIEHNRFLDFNLWSSDYAQEPAMPWVFVKEKITVASGDRWAGQRLGLWSESSGVNMTNLGAQRTVVRSNTFDGPMNGFASSGGATMVHRDSARDTDFSGNLCVHLVDDCVEPEHAKVNWRIWDNDAHDIVVFWSAAPVHYGPIFVFRNRVWALGSKGSMPELSGERPPVGSGTFLKGSGLNPARLHVRPIFYIIHNTVWTDEDGSGAPDMGFTPVSGLDDTLNGAASYNPVKYIRNNLFRVTRYAFLIGQQDWADGHDEDYNIWASAGGRWGARFDGVRVFNSSNVDGPDSLGAYRSALAHAPGRPADFGNGSHSNRIGPGGRDVPFVDAAAVDRLLRDPAAGDIRLAGGPNPAVDGGTPLPNISDRAGVDFVGSAPDIGAIERTD